MFRELGFAFAPIWVKIVPFAGVERIGIGETIGCERSGSRFRAMRERKWRESGSVLVGH